MYHSFVVSTAISTIDDIPHIPRVFLFYQQLFFLSTKRIGIILTEGILNNVPSDMESQTAVAFMTGHTSSG